MEHVRRGVGEGLRGMLLRVQRHPARLRAVAGRQEGQALVELAMTSIVFTLLLSGVLDFGMLYTNRLAVENAAREAARWAAKHPTAWDSTSTPASDTIEGQAIAAGSGDIVVNNDTDLVIQYSTVNPSTTTITYCGQYSATQAQFVAAGGYSQSTCVVPGSLINVTITYYYYFATGGLSSFGPGVNVSAVAASIEEI